MFGLFTSPLLVQDSNNKLAEKECDQSQSLAEVLHLLVQCQQLISLELLSGTSVSQLPHSDMNNTSVSHCLVQTRCLAPVPVIAPHVTRNEDVTTRELEQRKIM